MNKTVKGTVILIISGIILTIIIASGIYILFGVVGIEGKRVYPESAAVNEAEANISPENTAGATVIDETATYQTMNGFGASACWWSKNAGGWENSKEILSLLYSKEGGIGLNIYRYNLGAGSVGDENIYVERSRTECFLNADGTYDFTADANAQNALAQAKELAGDDLRVTLFCNSAPVLLTKNGKAYGSAKKDNDPWESNLDEANYEAFADYCYNTADYFLNQGYKVTDISPINEPQYAWSAWYNDDGSCSMNQEGCYYTKQQAASLLNTIVKRFKNSEVDAKGCKVSMFESGAAEGEGSTAAAYIDCILGKGPKYVFRNLALRNYFDTISMHSYWSDTDTKIKAAEFLSEKYSNYDVVCTEYCQMTNDENTGVHNLIAASEGGTNGMSIEYGVAMAKVIVDDLTILNAREWDWWTACSFGVYTDGLVYLNEEDHSDIQTSKRLWCLGNFSKFINEGAVRIACTSGTENLSSCAFKNTDGSTVIVYVNASENDSTTNLNHISYNNLDVYTTDETRNIEKTEINENTVNVPSQSVVTVVLK